MRISQVARSFVLSSLTLMSFSTYALTDFEALELGMMEESDFMISEMKSVLSPSLSQVGLEKVINENRLVISINKKAKGPDAQTMTVYENGIEIMKERVSTGKEERVKSTSGRTYISTTPKGYFRPTKVYKDYLSYTWNAPMPNAVFFIGGIAIHATGKSSYPQLGSRASGGCVRTTLEVSETIREKVMDSGKGSDFKIVNEAKGRNRIMNNSINISKISRDTGNQLSTKALSWDTVVVVHEN